MGQKGCEGRKEIDKSQALHLCRKAQGLKVPGTPEDVSYSYACGGSGGCAWGVEMENWLKSLLKGSETLRLSPLLYAARPSSPDSFLHVILYSLQRLKWGLYIGGH